jgi:hypothetical protein
MSADMNIDHGDSSRGMLRAAGAGRISSLGATTALVGAGVWIGAGPCGVAGCCACDGIAAHSAGSATRAAIQNLERDAFMLQSSND